MLALRGVAGPSANAIVRPVAGVECCLALWVAGAPEPEPLRPMAQELLEQLPARLRRTAAQLERRLPGWPLRAANWFYRSTADSYGDAMRELENETASRLACDLLAGSLLGHQRSYERRERLAADDAGALRRPEQVVHDVLEVVDAFWGAGFGSQWMRNKPRLDAASVRLLPSVARDFAGVLSALSPRAVLDVEADELSFVGGQGRWTVDCATLDAIDIVPSLWLRRRVVLLIGRDRMGLAVGLASRERKHLDSESLTPLLVALAEPRRLDIVRLCMREALCTQEIAARLGITEAPVSRHLKELERQGILVGQRFGRRVTYAVIPETVALLGQALCGLADTTGRPEHANVA